MLDKSLGFLFLNNFPEKIVDRYKELFFLNRYDDVELVKTFGTNPSFPDVRFRPVTDEQTLKIKDKTFETMFILTLPHVFNSFHCDRGLWWRLNVPIFVDSKQSDVLIGKNPDRNWEGYGKYIEAPIRDYYRGDKHSDDLTRHYDAIANHPGRQYPDAKIEDFDRIEFDRPILLNAHNHVHTWTNHTDKVRAVIMFRISPQDYEYVQDFV